MVHRVFMVLCRCVWVQLGVCVAGWFGLVFVCTLYGSVVQVVVVLVGVVLVCVLCCLWVVLVNVVVVVLCGVCVVVMCMRVCCW